MFTIPDTKTKLIAMDLDGTLTQHKSKLDDICKKTLDALAARYSLLIIGAGGCERIYNQMNHYPVNIIGYYGMQRSTVTNGVFTLTDSHTVKVNREDIAERISILRTKLGFTSYRGQSVEFHTSGVITFPILGTDAPLEQKLSFDPDRIKRRSFYDTVRGAFDEYTVFIGGSSSFDIVPRPFNKLYALEQYIAESGHRRDEVVYFGDDYGHGGNDEHIYLSDIQFISIDNFRDFPYFASKFLKKEL